MKEVNKIDREAFLENEKNGKERRRDMKARLKEKVQDKMESVTYDPKYPLPLHQNFVTFFTIDKKWQGKGKRKKIRRPVKPEDKEPYFGKASRFGRDPDEIYKDRVKTYNSGTDCK
jgi:hypothetical protein